MMQIETRPRRFIPCACDPRRAAFLNGQCPICDYIAAPGFRVTVPSDYYTPRRAA